MTIIETAVKHTTPISSMRASDLHLKRAELLNPTAGNPESPFFKRRKLLAQRAADKGELLNQKADLQDRSSMFSFGPLAKKMHREFGEKEKAYKSSLKGAKGYRKQSRALKRDQKNWIKSRQELHPGILMPPGGLD